MMQQTFQTLALLAAGASALTLADVCTTSYVIKSLPANNATTGIFFRTNLVTANPVYNLAISQSVSGPAASGLNYCNVTLNYYHNGLNDSFNLWYYLPDPAQFSNRFLATGGGGEAINSGQTALQYGPVYGAVAGLTDGGFGGFSKMLTDVILYADGSLNYAALYSFAYRGIHDMTVIGKQLTMNFYGTSKIYAYYSGCSEGGREGWSQIQRYGDLFNGAVVGAPAFRQAFQQTNHLFSGVVENTLGYAPPPCELAQINADTITACDGLDGKVDGVVSRTDLCALHHNISTSLGKPYSCAASQGNPFSGGGATPAVNGTVSAKGIAVARAILAGLHDSSGKQVYVPYQFSAPFTDAATSYNTTTGTYYASASGIGAQWVNNFLRETSSSTVSLSSLSYDALRQLILEGYQKYSGTLQTVWPDLSSFHSAGGKVIHYHGESDDSVPSSSSVIYQDAVRRTMYPALSYADSFAKLGDWYRLFLIPGGAHCMPSPLQPNAPWPVTMVRALFEWVEKDVVPVTLNGTHLSGTEQGQSQKLCAFPTRPLWTSNASDVQCVQPDAAALRTWLPKLDSIPLPVYADP